MAAAPRIEANPRKRSIPDDALIYREYAHQLMSKGEWGAYSRTARLCKVSHEHVRKVVARHRPQKVDDSLAYQPAPGEEEQVQSHEVQTAENSAEAALESATLQGDADLLRQLLEEELPRPGFEITSTPSSIAPATSLESATDERAVHFTEYPVIRIASVSQERQNQRIAFYLLLAFTCVMTAVMILVAKKSMLLPLLLFPEVMGMWWVTLEFRRVVYLRE